MRLLDKVIGVGWGAFIAGRRDDARALLSLCADNSDVSAAVIVFADAGVPDALEETEGVLASWFDSHGIAAAIVRPDHYVFGTARNAAELRALLRELEMRLRGASTKQDNSVAVVG